MQLSLRIATYNIRKALGNDRRRDPERTLRVIAALDADIILLQEADMRLGLRPSALPAAMFEGQPFRAISFDDDRDSLGRHGNAILIRDGIDVLHTAHADLPGLEPRGAVMADLAVQGRVIRVVGTHLGLIRASRRRQLSALRHFAEHAQISARLIAGDFNEWSNVAHLAGLGAEYKVLPSPPTFHARHPIGALDRIAVTSDFTLHSIAATLTPESRRASDHLPLVANLILQAKA